MKNSPLIDREQQVRELRALADADGAQMGLLYGRRRVGKTYLLQHAWGEDARLFYFLAGGVTPEQNRQDLLRELDDWSERPITPGDFPNWRTTFQTLFEHARDDSLIVVLDEFQYLLGNSKQEHQEVTSQLNAIWDREVKKYDLDLTLILCGSEIGTMKGIGAGGPLYGRISWRHRLGPFDYFNAARMCEGRSLRERIYIYAILGGLPEYLDALREDEELADAVARTVLSSRGEVHFQLERLLEQEQGLRDPRKYRAVLSAVATGATTTNEIKQRAFSSGSQHRVRRILETLEELGLVRRERNFRAGKKAAWSNRIADNAVRFWYRFVHPHRSHLQARPARDVWEHAVKPQLDVYTGKVFEQLISDAFRRHHDSWNFPMFVHWARWEGVTRDRRSIEIDIAAELQDQKLLTGEVKWSSSPVDLELHVEHQSKLQALANSGQRWAHEALEPEHSHGHLYVSAAGFTEYFRQRAQEDSTIHLVDLEDIFEKS